MVEMIVVIILIGILGAIGAARFFDRATFDAAGFADQAAAALRYAQKQAIAQNRPVTVRFDSGSVSLCFDSSSPCGQQVPAPFSLPTGTTYCAAPGWYCVLRPVSVSYTVSLGDISTTPHFLSFDALGRPRGDDADLSSVMTLTVVGGGAPNRQLNVEPETGYVH